MVSVLRNKYLFLEKTDLKLGKEILKKFIVLETA